MSLLGRLEDLSLTDIVQIVFLSRRTGILEIVNDVGRHTVLFRQGLVVNASAPGHPDLVTYLQQRGDIPAGKVAVIRQMEDSGIPCGTAVVELALMSMDDLTRAIKDRIQEVIAPLIPSREGEFNFLLSETMSAIDIEYEPDALFKEGGFSPQKMIGAAEGEKLKPLRGLEASLKAGKALVREAPSPAASQPPLPQAGEGKAKFKVAGGLFEVESPEQAYRIVVLLERNPMIRVAVKRAFGKSGAKVSQFGSVDDARAAITELFRSNSFFVTFLELSSDDSAIRLLQQIKRRNPRLPVVMIDSEADLRRRHDLLQAGADLYLTKPSEARLQPEVAEEELALFADELVLFAERAFSQWEQVIGSLGSEAGKRFYETADQENVDRTFALLKQLINELSDPSDITEVATTILRLSAEYLERGALFVVTDDEFVGVGGFGVDDMNARVRTLRISRSEPSILGDVSVSGEPHRGKLRKTEANVQLIERLGGLLPTEVAALPIMHSGRAIGILYGDNAEHRGPIDNMAGLEIFLSQAGYAFGNAVFAAQKAGQGWEA